MTQNLDEYFKSLDFGCTVKGIETLEEQRAINSGGVQMITIRKPSSQKETELEIPSRGSVEVLKNGK